MAERIQVAMQGTSEEILTAVENISVKVEDTGGVIVGSDKKKYLAELSSGFYLQPISYFHFPLNTTKVLGHLDDKFYYYFLTNGILKVSKSNDFDFTLFEYPANVASSRILNSSTPDYLTTKFYDNKLFFIYILDGNTKVGFFDIITETYNLTVNNSINVPIAYLKNNPSIDIYPEGYAVLTTANSYAEGDLSNIYLFKIDATGHLTSLGNPMQDTYSGSQNSKTIFFFYPDYFIRFQRPSGSNANAIKMNYSGAVISQVSVPNCILETYPLISHNNRILYLGNANTIIVYTPSSGTFVTRTVSGIPNSSRIFSHNNNIYFLDTSAGPSFNIVLTNSGLDSFVIQNVQRIQSHTVSSTISPNLFFNFSYGLIHFSYNVLSNPLPPSSYFVIDFNSYILKGYKEVTA